MLDSIACCPSLQLKTTYIVGQHQGFLDIFLYEIKNYIWFHNFYVKGKVILISNYIYKKMA